MEEGLTPIKQIIREEIHDEDAYKTWIEPIAFREFTGNTVHLSVPNRFFKDWILEHYKETIQVCASRFLRSEDLDILIFIDEKSDSFKKSPSVRLPDQSTTTGVNPFNTAYTFETFVIGKNNQFAQAACQAVAASPGKTYNPLFIYGGVGLGKTHLLNAIGNEALTQKTVLSPANISFTSGEEFTNEVINAIRFDRMDKFRDKFRNVNILMIDDIQFIAGKEATQAEFFHTFNALYVSKKQIIVTCDRFPKDIKNIEERLRSRFEWGLIADIQPPDIETKVAILKKKSEKENIHLTNDVAIFVASKAGSNIRSLEGLLTRLIAFSSLAGKPITIPFAREILKGIINDTEKTINVEDIQKVVCNHYGIRVSDIKSKRRPKAFVMPRQVAMYLSRSLCNISLSDIGEKFGGKDHSTVIHAINKIKSLLEQDPYLIETLEEIKGKIYA